MIQERIKITQLKVHKDERGLLSKIFDYNGMSGKNIQDIYLTYTTPGENRADHYHKKTIEWFCAIKGEGTLKFKDADFGVGVHVGEIIGGLERGRLKFTPLGTT